ncbi:MAG: ABC transporter permease [Clostridia bacterium]|nr:ABC transporter permease [Clostridia bacterium]
MSKKQRSRYSLGYLISQAFKSLFRNGMMSVASIAVLMSCLTVMGSFALLVYNINYNLDQLGSLNEIVVYCDTDLSDEDVDAIGRRVRLMDNVNEEAVKLITKEEVLIEERQKYSEFTDLFDQMDQSGVNPYPDTFVIQYEDNNKVSALQMELEQIEGVHKVQCRADLAETIESLKNSIIFIFMWFLVILFLVSVFVIINTIKLAVHSRKQEISIMRYVGATRWFITTPFVIEGIIIGVVSSGIAYAIEYFLYRTVYNAVSVNYGMIDIVPFGELQNVLLIGFAAVGIITGIIGTSISLSKHLKA